MNYIDPIYKWTGGKRKEISKFSPYYPTFVSENSNFKYVEPFFGGGAVYWSLGSERNHINDIDTELVNFLKVLKTNMSEVRDLVEKVGFKMSVITEQEKRKEISISEAKTLRGEDYYYWRNLDRNNGLESLSEVERAARFYIVNQLAFNGMRRFNSRGEFNVPYGNYKQLNFNVDQKHLSLLEKTEITRGSFKDVMVKNDNLDTFIYMDPPYTREFTEYSTEGEFTKEHQIDLFETFRDLKSASAMIIINKDEFTSDLYKDYIRGEYGLKYATNIKNRYDQSVVHLIITNY
jgi:DNA adenine methylase